MDRKILQEKANLLGLPDTHYMSDLELEKELEYASLSKEERFRYSKDNFKPVVTPEYNNVFDSVVVIPRR